MTRVSRRTLVLVGLLVALVLAGVVSYYASSAPDGLNRVAIDQGFAEQERKHRLGDSPLAGYEAKGVEDDRFAGGLAGVAGVLLTFAVVGGGTMLLRRKSR